MARNTTPQECIAEFETRINERDWSGVAELIAPDAVFFFNDGCFRGHANIRKAFEASWAWNPEDERYRCTTFPGSPKVRK